MRTKLLFLAAAAAVVTTVSAQVYSVNVVGYVNVNLTDGFNLVCNPLNNTTGNQLSKILPLTAADTGASVFVYRGGTFVSSTWVVSAWSDDLTIAPGEGFFIQISGTKTVTFVGEVNQDAASNMSVPAGWALLGSLVPQSGALDTALAFPSAQGDAVFFYRSKAYTSATYLQGVGWIGDVTPAVGEGFWSQKNATAQWDRNFKVQ